MIQATFTDGPARGLHANGEHAEEVLAVVLVDGVPVLSQPEDAASVLYRRRTFEGSVEGLTMWTYALAADQRR